MRVGAIVRVPLHGRRVRGWVVDDDVESETTRRRLLEVLAVASDGPPADVVDLAGWIAWRWARPADRGPAIGEPPQPRRPPTPKPVEPAST